MKQHIKAPAFGSPRSPIAMSDICSYGNVNGAAVLLCPGCHGSNLHQGGVTVNQRPAEDAPGHATHVDGGQASSVRDDEAFTGRRDCLAVEFSCEQCVDKRFALRIAQHKGNTFVFWELA